MSFVVFWLERRPGCAPVSRHEEFTDKEMNKGQELLVTLRKQGASVTHATMQAEMEGMVGKAGVDAIIDGKTPDGEDYTWSKEGRAGRMRASDLAKQHKRADEQ